MALPWVRLDTQFAQNPKVLSLIADKKHRAAFAWVCSLGYSGAQGTDGFLPKSCLQFIHATPSDARDLVEIQLWHETLGGWEINDWADYQQSSEEAAQRKKRAQEAAAKRWENARK